MLDQYIINRLKENDQQLKSLKDKLKKLCSEEESCRNMIQKLLDAEDVGIEVFSPRNPNDKTKQKISDIKKQMEEIRLQQAEIDDQIEHIKSEEEKYQEMLAEIKNRNSEAYQIEQLKMNPPVLEEKEAFSNILNRVNRCLETLDMDEIQCKSELVSLRYYLKALLSKS